MFLTKVRIQNFKSIKDQSINLVKLNVLLGENGSGKTNFLEFFKLIKLALTSNEKPFNPFTPWWGFQNVVWEGDTNLSISGHFEFKIDNENMNGISNFFEDWSNESFIKQNYLQQLLKLFSNLLYSIKIGQDQFGEVQILEEQISITKLFSLIKNGRELNYRYQDQFFETVIEPMIDRTLEFLDEKQLTLNEVLNSNENSLDHVDRRTRIKEQLKLLKMNREINSKVMRVVPFRQNINANILFSTVTSLFGLILPEELLRYHPYFRVNRRPYPYPRITSELLNYFGRLVFLRPPDLRKIREPIFIRDTNELKEDGSNLAAVLHQLQQNQKQNDVRELFATFFKNTSIGFKFTMDSRLMLTINENGLELQPHGISDGFYKLLFVLTGIYKTNSLLIVDEIENSLYFKAIEFLLDTIKQEELQVIISTHSPIIVDILDLNEVLIFSKEMGETKIKRPKNVGKLKEELNSKGLTHSDAWEAGRFEE